MILVDTSVLIAFLKGSTGNKTQRFRAVLERNVPFGINALIMQEILQGAGSEREFSLLREYLSSQRLYLPSDPVVFHLEAARIYFSCRRRGITVRSTIDCLIAQTAIEHNLLLLHDDRDFDAIARVAPLRFF